MLNPLTRRMDSTSRAAAGGAFPLTRRSLVAAVGSGDREVRRSAFGALVEAYWKPVYTVLRLRWRLSPVEAEDATQEFFARALEKDWFSRYDPSRARFRTYLRSCLDAHAANRAKAARREKRGGGVQTLSLDFAAAEGELAYLEPAATEADAEELFYREWVRGLFAFAVERLRRGCEESGRGLRWALFAAYDLDDADEEDTRPTYGGLAAIHGVAVTKVTNELAAARRELRRTVLDLLREVTGSEAEFRDEARALLGVEVG
jgi:RNA polymerase sigma factor (sigma-70 family)